MQTLGAHGLSGVLQAKELVRSCMHYISVAASRLLPHDLLLQYLHMLQGAGGVKIIEDDIRPEDILAKMLEKA